MIPCENGSLVFIYLVQYCSVVVPRLSCILTLSHPCSLYRALCGAKWVYKHVEAVLFINTRLSTLVAGHCREIFGLVICKEFVINPGNCRYRSLGSSFDFCGLVCHMIYKYTSGPFPIRKSTTFEIYFKDYFPNPAGIAQ
jgi:hypothetical protein